MEIVLTGTGSPLPDANRAGPSTLVKVGNGADATHILIDAGRGTVMRLAGAGSFPGFLAAVLVTHLHSDHICALNDVITTHWIMTRGNGTLAIHGPPGIAQFVERQLHALEPDIGYRIAHHDALTEGPRVAVTELAPGDAFTVGPVAITTAATVHAPVEPTIGYRLEHEGAVAAIVGDTIPGPIPGVGGPGRRALRRRDHHRGRPDHRQHLMPEGQIIRCAAGPQERPFNGKTVGGSALNVPPDR